MVKRTNLDLKAIYEIKLHDVFRRDPDAKWLEIVCDWLNDTPRNARQQRLATFIGALNEATNAWVNLNQHRQSGDRFLAVCVLHLWSRGILDQVHLCKHCKWRWFIAPHKNYRYCSERCSYEFHAHTESAKENQRRRQREYRKRLQKRREAELAVGMKRRKAPRN